MSEPLGPSTRAVHAGLPEAVSGAPLGPPIVMAAPYHLPGEISDTPYGYARSANPTFTALEAAVAELEGGPALAFASGAAAIAAVVLPTLARGDVLVAPTDGYQAIRDMAERELEPRGVEVRWVPTQTEAIVAACDGARLVWVETPSNPRLEVCDLRAVAAAAHAAGAELAVDNTLATGLGQQPLALGADVSVAAGTKALAGHSDVLLGVVATATQERLDAVHAYRTLTGAVPGPFEAWLVHRSIATLDLRLTRASDNALAVAQLLEGRDDVTGVCHPSLDPVAATQMTRFGPLVSFDLGTGERARRFLRDARLIADATSFGGVHSTAERRARWGMDAVGEGFIRLSAGIEDPADLLADVEAALA